MTDDQAPSPPPPTGRTAELPAHAVERILAMRPDAAGQGGLFTSDLTVNEFLLVKESGFEPLGLVTGCAIYHIGIQYANWSKNEEMAVLTQAMYHARELAMDRMEAEAEALGADGIVGVRLIVKPLEWSDSLAEFLAVGTAVRAVKPGQAYRTPQGKPFTSDLGGQDFWTLLSAGYRPLGLVMGTCVYHVAHQSIRQWFKNAGQTVEMVEFTRALYDARVTAMERMQAQAVAIGAEGIVNMAIREKSYRWSSHVIEFFAVGTAVVSMRADHHLPAPQLVLSLDG